MNPTMLKNLRLIDSIRSRAERKPQMKRRNRPRVVIPFKTNPASIKVPWSCLMDPTRSKESAIKFRAKPDPTITKMQQANAAKP